MGHPLPYQKTIIAICFLGFLICMLLIFGGCASSNLGRGLNVAVAGSGVADLVSTSQAEGHGGREANPLMGDSEIRRVLIKSAGIGAVIGLASILDAKQRPVLAHVFRAAVIALNAGLVIHNARWRP